MGRLNCKVSHGVFLMGYHLITLSVFITLYTSKVEVMQEKLSAACYGRTRYILVLGCVLDAVFIILVLFI